ncbi:hypothetical protein G3A43_40815 [Paraburkholderia aspalathi]|uniref:hypothetical protein n=1 Tax=Paraburkholderia nemoris TaxID=2793076 RepID=UPI00190C2EC5|nr:MULTISPECIES: hypothetical protein [Paraburkholderia]MBK3786546.1 hypothetical protein [Paraburkholderia aspalathi]
MNVEYGVATVYIKGRTPLILNKLSEKARHELLLPSPRKTAADRQQSLKHNPADEFLAAAHMIPDDRAPTLLAIPTTALKGAMRDAALEAKGTSRSQIGRLTFIPGALLPVYGTPMIFLSVVRMADPGRTPDIRTRVIVPEWATIAEITFMRPQLRAQSVVNLLHAAGLMMGCGDWRPQKGSGSYGQFEVLAEPDADFNRIMKTGGRKAQVAAMKNPVAYDTETEELLAWFTVELRRRGIKAA